VRTPILCKVFESRLPDLAGLDGEPLEAEARELDDLLRHSFECPVCADELDAYRATVELLRSLPRRVAPRGFLAWVQNRA
jgi:hypothetical protein